MALEVSNLNMIIAEIKFKNVKKGDSDKENLRDLAEIYLGSLCKYGNIYGDSVLAWAKDELYGLVKLASIDAFSNKYHTKYSLDELERVKKGFGSKPSWKIVENSEKVIDWKTSSFFYLFTHAFDNTSPLCSGETGKPIPLYLLPISDLDRAYFWAYSYRYHDRIWLN
jgi:predicted  nucleic acid-binding Zn ribbon protein